MKELTHSHAATLTARANTSCQSGGYYTVGSHLPERQSYLSSSVGAIQGSVEQL
ncbi:hypothetical protein M3J09_011214 [Ascochyta lentis]